MKFGVMKFRNKKKFTFVENFCENHFNNLRIELFRELLKGDYKNSSLFDISLKKYLITDRMVPYVYFGIMEFKGNWLHECYDIVQNRNEV